MEPEKLQIFIRYYLDVDSVETYFNAKACAEKANCSPSEFLQHTTFITEVQEHKARLRELLNNSAAKMGVTTTYLVEQAKEILERCMMAKQAMVKGKLMDYACFDSAGAISAINVLKDFTGGFDKNTAHGSGKPTYLGALTHDEVKKLRNSADSQRTYYDLLGHGKKSK
jgi:hypothetical protein